MSTAFNAATAPQVQTLLNTLSTILGVSFDLSHSAGFKAVIDSPDGSMVNFRLNPLDQGLSAHSFAIPAGMLVEPASGTPNLNGATGTATLTASTVTITVPAAPDGGTAVPVGSTIYATVTTPGGNTKRLNAVRAGNTTITISSAGLGYGSVLESAGASGTLVAGTVDIALSNSVGDRLAVALSASHGTAGVLSVARKDANSVTVTSWLAGTGIQVLDLSDVKVYNFGQSANELSTVRWCVIRP